MSMAGRLFVGSIGITTDALRKVAQQDADWQPPVFVCSSAFSDAYRKQFGALPHGFVVQRSAAPTLPAQFSPALSQIAATVRGSRG
jgi:hypothetical protein